MVPIQQIQAQSQREGDVAVTLTPGGPRFESEVLAEYGLGLVLPGEVELRRTYWLNISLEMVRVPRVRAVSSFLRKLAEEFDFC